MFEDQYVVIDQDKLYCRYTVKNPNYPWLIFLHEALGSAAQWYSFPEYVTATLPVNVLFYDRAGHGKSTAEKQPRPLDFHHLEVPRLQQLISYFGIRQYVCVGHSDGGVISLLAAAARSDRLLASVCISAMGERDANLVDNIHTIISTDEFTEVRQRLSKYHTKPNNLVDGWINTWGQKGLPQLGLLEQLPNITIPTLIIHGTDDPFGGVEQLYSFTKRIPHAENYIAQGLKHHPHLEDAQKIGFLVRDFVQQNIPDIPAYA